MDERLTALLDLVDVQLWVQSLDTYYWANKAYCKYMGITQEQSHNLKLSEVLCKENLKQCLLSNKEVFEAKKSVKSKEWVKDQHGEKRLLEITKASKI